MTWSTLYKTQKESGVTFIEVLIVMFLIGNVFVSVFGLFWLSLRTTQTSERRVVAIALANERAEMVRNLPYVDVGTSGGVPAGNIPQEEVVVRNGVPYTVSTNIVYVDDAFDGLDGPGPSPGPGKTTICHKPGTAQENTITVGDPAVPAHQAHGDTIGPCAGGGGGGGGDDTGNNLDYKQVRISVSWPNPNNVRPVLVVTLVAPQGLEGGAVAGTLDFQALDAQGQGVPAVDVLLVNNSVNPVINLSTQTDNTGRLLLPGLPESAATYEISISKAGYTSEQTYDSTAGFIPDVDHQHMTMLTGQVTEKTFFIDQVSSLDIATQFAGTSNSFALDFNGTSDYVTTLSDDARTAENFTLAAWFNAEDTSNPYHIVWQGNSSGNGWGNASLTEEMNLSIGAMNFSTSNPDADKVSFYIGDRDDDTDTVQVEADFTDAGVWHHLAAVVTDMSGTPTAELFLDGVSQGTDSGITSRTSRTGWDTSLQIGKPGADERYFNGMIDDVRLYTRALTAAEVQQLAAGGDPLATDLASHWRLNEEFGSTATDSSGNGDDGTWQGSLVSTTDVPFAGSGGQATNITYTLQGSKTIGTTNGVDPVYLFSVTDQTNGSGQNSHTDLVWDSYQFSLSGTSTGYDIAETDIVLPAVINPNESRAMTVTLVPYTPISLHVTVADPSGAPINNASVRLQDNGYDTTLITGAAGQVLFDSLPSNDDYTLDITANGYDSISATTVTVSGTTRLRFDLVPS